MIPTHDSDRTRRSEIIVNHLRQLNDYDFVKFTIEFNGNQIITIRKGL
jgi:hypothetical protein